MGAPKSESEAVATEPTVPSATQLSVKNDMMRSTESGVASDVEACDKKAEADDATVKDSAPSDEGDVAAAAIKPEFTSDNYVEVDSLATKIDASSQKNAAEVVKEENKDGNKIDGMTEFEVGAIVEAPDGKSDPMATQDAPLPENVAQEPIKSEVKSTIDVNSDKTSTETTVAQATETPGAPKLKYCQIVPILTHNPDYDAHVRSLDLDKEEALTKLAEDIDRCARDGDIDELCTACDNKGSSLCNGCKLARYCSRECQVADWHIHKKVCADFAGATADEKRPSPEHHRILFFPAFSTKPELHWAIHHETENNEWLEFEHHDIAVFMRTACIRDLGKHKGHTVLNSMYPGNRRIGHLLTAISFPAVKELRNPLDPKLLNQSINALSKPGYLRPWFRPIPIFADARHLNERVAPKIRDITPRDVNAIVRILETCDCVCVAKPAHYPGEIISGLCINDPKTDLNKAMGITQVFDSAMVPLSPFRSSDYVIAMSFHLGLRWYIRQGNYVGLQSGMTLWNDGNLRYLAYVCTLHEVTKPSEDDTHSLTLPQFDPVFSYGSFAGSVVILHGSGNPVHVQHVLAFNAYLDEVFVTKGVASKQGFEKFWSEYKQKMGKPLSSVPSPYKWEKNNVKDRLGFFHSDFVMRAVADNIGKVWGTIVTEMGRVRHFKKA